MTGTNSNKTKKLLIPLLILFFLYMWSSRFGSDGYELEYLLSADNLVKNGSFYLASSPDGVPGVFNRTPDLPLLPRHNLLQVLLVVPFYLAGTPFNRLVEPAPSGLLALPLGSLAAVSLLNPLLTITSVYLLILICRRLYRSEKTAVMAGLIYGIATMAWPYAVIGMEPLQNLCILLSILLYLKLDPDNPTTRSVTWLAVSLTALMHTKISAPLIALPISFTALILILKFSKARAKDTCIYCGILLASSLTWFYLYHLRSNAFYSSSFFENFVPGLIPRNIVGLLVSPGKGLLIYNPIFFWLIPGFITFYRSNRLLAWLMASMSLLTLGLTACWDWSLIEECWGPRYLMPMVPMIIIAGASHLRFRKTRAKMFIFGSLLIASILIQVPATVYPNVCLMKYVHSESNPVVDMTTWLPELSPIRVGWHMIGNQLAHSSGQEMRSLNWHYYRGIIGWGARPEILEFSNPNWNYPYAAPFIVNRFLNKKVNSQSSTSPDPGWIFPMWFFFTLIFCAALGMWYNLSIRNSREENSHG